jgi:hypothetical protein
MNTGALIVIASIWCIAEFQTAQGRAGELSRHR